MKAFLRGEDVERFFDFSAKSEWNQMWNPGEVKTHWHPSGDGELVWSPFCEEEGGKVERWSVSHCDFNAPPPLEPRWRPNRATCRLCEVAAAQGGGGGGVSA